MTGSDWYDGRERDTEGNKIKQGDAGTKIAGLSEIGFDSKPISEIGYMEEPHLKVSVGGGNFCKKGQTCGRQGGTNTRRTRKQKQFIFELKTDFKNRF